MTIKRLYARVGNSVYYCAFTDELFLLDASEPSVELEFYSGDTLVCSFTLTKIGEL